MRLKLPRMFVLLCPLIPFVLSCSNPDNHIIVLEHEFVQKLSKPGDRGTLTIKDPAVMPGQKHNVMIQKGSDLLFPVKDSDWSKSSTYIPIITDQGEVVSSEPPGHPGSIYVSNVGIHNGVKIITFERG
ncbi:hypothetical protein CCB81_09145 [Armatimonadetes bacterium Uphvl-Ar2]|nr:hypothetical protein CCB81_09145 [Armatimonadetes bacterium Uphvl-Ar2]